MADERKPKNVSKKLPCRKDKKKPWYTMWNEYAIYIYLYIDIDIKASARFKTCLKKFWLNLFGKNNTKSRPTIGAENLFFQFGAFCVFFLSLLSFAPWQNFLFEFQLLDIIQWISYKEKETKKKIKHTHSNRNWTQHTFNHRKRVQVWQ